MTQARLASSVLVAALRRLAEAEGGNAAVLAKGDAAAGAVLLVLAERNGEEHMLERILQPDGRYAWQNQAAGNPAEMQKFLDRRRKYDPDIWIIELTVPSAERFTAQINALD